MQTTRISILLVLLLTLLTLPAAAQQYANGGMFSTASIAGMLPVELPGERGIEAGAADAAKAHRPAAPSPAPVPAFLPIAQPVILHRTATAAVSMPATAPVPAPQADLHMFSGARIRNVIQLHWETVSNEGTAAFAIERRSQLQKHWQSVGYVRPAQPGGSNYRFLDKLHGDGVAYYRLRQLRTDGSAVVSPVISVTPDAVPPTFSIWTEASGPFQNYGTVSFGLEERSEVKVTLHDRFGSTITTLLDYRIMDAGHHVLPIATSRLASGLYFLQLHSKGGSRKLLLPLL
ncbi:MAG: hypothetical protein RRA94_00165 [Bacteroidota bacterium]|nr:hypothetical protein [Bacteroidota bacterium]